jgi:DNA (cytosine-5)-methyltransferase 1
MQKTVAIDLFCGIGGLSLGLKKAGLEVAAGADIDESCRYAYEHNIGGRFLSCDIAQLQGDDLLHYWESNAAATKVLVGCAPCQPFSSHTNKGKDKKGSKKWNLLSEFGRLVADTLPEVVSMENVPNLANQEIFSDFVGVLQDAGYEVSYSKVYCPDYGMAQKRKRLVLLASRLGPIALIPKTHGPDAYVPAKQLIESLPMVESGEECPSDKLHKTTKLTEINLKRIRASKPNGTWKDWSDDLRLECHKKASGSSYLSVYGRIDWNEPAPTITTQFFNYGTGRFGHPIQDRALTLREGALLQSFPPDYVFCPPDEEVSISKIATHIGNAVPVDLGYVIGQSIVRHLSEIKN